MTDDALPRAAQLPRLLLESDAFWIALKNNLFLMIVVPLFVIPLALFLAACISRGVRRGEALPRRVLLPQPARRRRGDAAVAAPVQPAGRAGEHGARGHRASKASTASPGSTPKNLYWALIPIIDLGRVRVQHGAVPRRDGERPGELLRGRHDRRRQHVAAVLDDHAAAHLGRADDLHRLPGHRRDEGVRDDLAADQPAAARPTTT